MTEPLLPPRFYVIVGFDEPSFDLRLRRLPRARLGGFTVAGESASSAAMLALRQFQDIARLSWVGWPRDVHLVLVADDDVDWLMSRLHRRTRRAQAVICVAAAVDGKATVWLPRSSWLVGLLRDSGMRRDAPAWRHIRTLEELTEVTAPAVDDD
jgi:hypothetical protein